MFMKKVILYLSISLSINVFSQTTDWVKAYGGPYSDKGISIGADSLGFIYISGFFNGEADFGPFTLNASYPNNKNIFVAKMDSTGAFLWAVPATAHKKFPKESILATNIFLFILVDFLMVMQTLAPFN